MKFKYEAYDKDGKKIKGVIEANDIHEAKNLLKDLALVEIKPKKTLNVSLISKANKKELIKTFRILGLYLRASIPLKKAISLTKNQTEDQKILKFLRYLEEEVKKGSSLSEAIKNQKIIKLPNFVFYSVQISESSAKLDEVLIQISEYLEKEEKIASKTVQALVYPLFIITVSLILVIVMMNTIVPKIVKIFENLNQQLPKITQITISVSHYLQKNYLFIVTAVLAAVILFSLFYKKSHAFKKAVDSLLLKIPTLNRLIIDKNLLRATTLTHTLTNSGIHFINALKMAAETVDNEILKEKLKKSLQDVSEGKKLSTSLKKHSFPNRTFIEAVSLIEETSSPKEILQNLSEIYLEEYNSKISVFLSLLEPIMILIVGGMVGFIVISMLLPIFNMNVMR